MQRLKTRVKRYQVHGYFGWNRHQNSNMDFKDQKWFYRGYVFYIYIYISQGQILIGLKTFSSPFWTQLLTRFLPHLHFGFLWRQRAQIQAHIHIQAWRLEDLGKTTTKKKAHFSIQEHKQIKSFQEWKEDGKEAKYLVHWFYSKNSKKGIRS